MPSTEPSPEPSLSERLKAEGLSLGFDAVGIAPAVAPPGYPSYQAWLNRGLAGPLAYMERQAPARAHPEHVFEGARSVVVATVVYGERSADSATVSSPTTGKVARYAQGLDYHEVFWRKLEQLLAWLQGERPGTRGRAVCDTAPLLERDFAQLAGLGWVGKNTMLIDRKLGSFTLIGALLVDVELDVDRPHAGFHCGTCTRCLEACPTSAFPEPGVLDAGRCLSTWTIEHKGPIPEEFASRLEGWVFGCDICQEVCPWNRKAPDARLAELKPDARWTNPDLIGWLEADAEAFRRGLRHSALKRTKRSGLLRNAALILGSRQVAEAVPALSHALNDPDPVVREAAAWGLRRIDTPAARLALGECEQVSDTGEGASET